MVGFLSCLLEFYCSLLDFKRKSDPGKIETLSPDHMAEYYYDTSCNYPSSGRSYTRARCSAPAAPRLVTRAVITRRPDGVS